jgi:hypothetical protein
MLMYHLAVAEDSIDQKQITLCREHCLPTSGLQHYIEACKPEFVFIGRERQFMAAVMKSMMKDVTFYGNSLLLQVCGLLFSLGSTCVNQCLYQDMLRTRNDETKKKTGSKKKSGGGNDDDDDDDDDDDNDAAGRGGSSKAANEKFERVTKALIICLTHKKTPYLHRLGTVTAEEVEHYSQGSQLLEDEDGWLSKEDERNWDVARYLLYCELSTLA